MALHDIRPRIVLIDEAGVRSVFQAPADTRYSTESADWLRSTHDLIWELGLPFDTGQLTTGDRDTRQLTGNTLIAHVKNTAEVTQRLEVHGWTPDDTRP